MDLKTTYKVVITVPLEVDLVEEIDELISPKKISRSAYLRAAIKEKVEKDKKQKN